MPDLLTERFKQELLDRGVVASDNEIEAFLSEKRLQTTKSASAPVPTAPTQTLWEIAAQGRDVPDWGLDYESSALSILGKGLWSAIDVAAFTLPSMAVRAAGAKEFEEMTIPKTFGERAAAGVGGVFGFMGPFTVARGIASAALKGASVLKGGQAVGYGAAAASKQFTKNATRILKNDKEFVKWWAESGRNPKDIGKWIEKSELMTAPKNAIKAAGSTQLSGHALRTKYAEQLEKNIGNIIREKVDDAAKFYESAGETFAVSDRAISLIEAEVKKYVGGKYNFPITNLHQYLALKWGNTKYASIAAAAAEEAILFSAVELPMDYISSLYNDEFDFEAFSTLTHSVVLGSALGIIRPMPGGADMPIFRSAFARMGQYLSKRKRWTGYNVKDASQRIDLARHAEMVWDSNNQVFASLRLPDRGLVETVERAVVREDLAKFAENAVNAQVLKDFMVGVEGAFLRKWWPGFMKQAGSDIYKSIPRMFAGTLAFNTTLYGGYIRGEVPVEDAVFHTLLGAVMTKRGKDLEWKDAKGVTQFVPGERRPYIYDSNFEKTNEYLNIVGMDINHAAYKSVLNNISVLKNYGKPDLNHHDMQKLVSVAKESGIIVSADTESKIRNENVSHELYDTLQAVLEGSLEQDQRVLNLAELKETQLASLLLQLRETPFKTLDKYRTADMSKGKYKGVSVWSDVLDIVADASGGKLEQQLQLYMEALVHAYNRMYQLEAIEKGKDRNDYDRAQIIDGKIVGLRPIAYDYGAVPENNKRLLFLFGNGKKDNNNKSVLGILNNRIEMSARGDIFMTKEMLTDLFGGRGVGHRGEMDQFDRSVTELIFGEGALADDNLVLIGDAFQMDAVKANMFREGIRKVHLELQNIRDADKRKSVFGEDVGTLQQMMARAFGKEGQLPDEIVVEHSKGKPLEVDSAEQKFASNLLAVLRSDPKNSTLRTDLVGTTRTTAFASDISEIMKLFDSKGLMQGFRGTEQEVLSFIDSITNYTRRKGLANATRADGTPLTGQDLATISVLANSKLMGPNFDMVNIEVEIGNLKEYFLNVDLINKKILSGADHTDIKNDFAMWVNGNSNKVANVMKELERAGETFYKLLEDAAEKMRGDSKDIDLNQSVAMLLGDFLSIYEGYLAPLRRGTTTIMGKNITGGILKESGDVAAVTSDFLYKMVATFNDIRKGNVEITHNQLIEEISRVYTTSNAHKEFMTTVMNSVLDRQGNVTRVIEILKKYKLMDKDNVFNLREDDKTIKQTVKEAAYDIQIATQPHTTDRAIEILVQRDQQDFNVRQHSDSMISMTLDKAQKDWGLLISAPGLAEIGPNWTAADLISDIVKSKGDFTLKNFMDYMTQGMRKEKNGIVYKGEEWKKMEPKDKLRFIQDMTKVFNGIQEGKRVRNLKLAVGEPPLATPENNRNNELLKYLEDTFGEIVFIDPEFRDTDQRLWDVRRVSTDLQSQFYSSAGLVGHNVEALKAMSIAEAGKLTTDSGYLVAWLGDLDYGIGIPIIKGGLDALPVGPDKLASQFVERLNSVRERFSDRQDIISLADALIERYVTNNDTRIVDVRTSSDADIPIDYSFRGVISGDPRTHENASLMMTVVFGDMNMGEHFWNAAVNSKRESKQWSSEKELAHDVLRRSRLFANGSTTNLSTDRISGIIELIRDSGFAEDSDVMNTVRDVLDPISRSGMVNAHLIRDEGSRTEDRNPSATSAYENLRLQLMQENRNRPAGVELEGLERQDIYPGGLGDTSHFNSVVIVNRSFLEALKLMTGDYFHDSTAGKPIIAFADDSRAAFIGKTMFMIDDNFEPYMERHDINMVIFTSAAKVVGRDYENSIIDLPRLGINDAQSLLDATVSIDHQIGLPIDAIQMQSWHHSDNDARIPMHVGNDLVGSELNQSYFNWLMRDRVIDYEDKLGTLIGSGNINNMTSFAKVLFGEVDSDVDNVMYSTITRWLGSNGYALPLPFKNTMQNAMMRHFMDRAGMFSPLNVHGSQSVLVPSYLSFDHADGLRNTIFQRVGGNRSIYSHGQIQIGSNNRSKAIGDNISIIVHHPDRPDELIDWSDFVSNVREGIRAGERGSLYLQGNRINRLRREMDGNVENFYILPRGDAPKAKAKTLDELFGFLERLNGFMRDGVTAEIAVTAHRTPSTRSSDKVIVGLKGFINEGNYARLNTVDVWTRLEADHDIDKLNYWWDTPSDVRDAWAGMAGNVMSVTDGGRPKTSLNGLSLMDPSSIIKYNFDAKRASFMRGQVVKARRMKQFLEHYKGFYADVDGFSVRIMESGVEKRIVVDQRRLEDLDEMLATDIQMIVDSKDGYPEEYFTKEYLRDILFGRAGFRDPEGNPWEGIFVKEVLGREGFSGEGKLQEHEKDLIYYGIQPYRNLLQLATDVYESGEQKRVDYQSYVDGFKTYRDTMKRLNRYAYKRLARKYGADKVGEIFFEDRNLKKMRDVYGLQQAMMPSPGRVGERGVFDTTKDLLPFDRGIWATASIDRMSLAEPTRSHRLEEQKFDEIWERYIDDEGMTDLAVRDIMKHIQNDAKTISFLNVIDRQLTRARRSERKAKRYNDEELVDWLGSRRKRLERLKNKLNDKILSDDAAGIAIRNTIKFQIIRSLTNGSNVYLPSVSKVGDKITYGRKSKVNLFKMSESKRKSWINKNMGRINAAVWDKDSHKLAVDIKGMASNEYAQIVMWQRTLSSFTGFMLDPSKVPYAHTFETSVKETRDNVSRTWSSWFKNRDYAANEREDIVSADIMRTIEKQYSDWEDVNPGLGKLWVFKFMTPEPDGRTVTYYNKHFLPGFSEIDKQVKFITLGLNFFATTKQIFDSPVSRRVGREANLTQRQMEQWLDPKQLIFRELAETFTDAMSTLYNQVPIKRVANSASDDIRTRIDGEVLDSRSGIEDFSLKNTNDAIDEARGIFKLLDSGDIESIDQISSDVKLLYGVTGDVALDYLSLKGAPLGLDKLYDIKKLSEFYFAPKKVLNSRGQMRNVKSLKSYYGFVKRNASVYFGSLAERDLLIRKDIPLLDSDPYGGVYSRTIEDANMMKQIAREKHRSIDC